jgi:hypothetical protein
MGRQGMRVGGRLRICYRDKAVPGLVTKVAQPPLATHLTRPPATVRQRRLPIFAHSGSPPSEDCDRQIRIVHPEYPCFCAECRFGVLPASGIWV